MEAEAERRGEAGHVVYTVVEHEVRTLMFFRYASTELELNWYRIVDNRVSGQGWEEQSITLSEVTASGDGTFRVTVEVPADVGGAHLLEPMVGAMSLTSTNFSSRQRPPASHLTRAPGAQR